MSLSILIPESKCEKVLKRLNKIARTAGIDIARQAGFTTLKKPVMVEKQSAMGTYRVASKTHFDTITCARFTVGDLPRSSGYSFVARIQHQEGGNIIARAPFESHDLDSVLGVDTLKDFQTMSNKCDHCDKQRARKETFIVRSPTGLLMQIGRNCLVDFLMTNAAQMVAIAEFVGACDGLGSQDEESWGGSWRRDCDPAWFVACAISVIAVNGFRKSEFERSTKSDAGFVSGACPPYGDSVQVWKNLQPTAEHQAKAALVVEWCKGLPTGLPEGIVEYFWNLHIAVQQHDTGKNRGLLASAAVAYDRAMGEAAGRSKKEDPGFAAHVGAVFEGSVTLVRRSVIETLYGSKAICTFKTDAGHTVVWFATGRSPSELERRFRLKGKVKKCDVYKGVCQTVIQRAKWEEIQAPGVQQA